MNAAMIDGTDVMTAAMSDGTGAIIAGMIVGIVAMIATGKAESAAANITTLADIVRTIGAGASDFRRRTTRDHT